MTAIDFLTASPREVLARSIARHPSVMSERLAHIAADHARFSRNCYDRTAADIAARMSAECRALARMVDNGGEPDSVALAIIDLGLSHSVQALTVAMELQLVPRSLRGDIAGRLTASEAAA